MNIEWLLNKAKQKFYPITHAKSVLVGENNETLDTELDGINNNLSQLEIDLKMLGYTVPKEMPIKNYVDSDGVFHQRVGRVNLGERNWVIFDGRFLSTDFVAKSKTTNLLTKKYKPVSSYGDNVNGTIYANGAELYICDSSYTDSSSFKKAMQGVYIYYELAEEKLIKVDGNEAVENLKNDLDKLSIKTKTIAVTLSSSTFDLTPELMGMNAIDYVPLFFRIDKSDGRTIYVECGIYQNVQDRYTLKFKEADSYLSSGSFNLTVYYMTV